MQTKEGVGGEEKKNKLQRVPNSKKVMQVASSYCGKDTKEIESAEERSRRHPRGHLERTTLLGFFNVCGQLAVL